MEKGRQNYYYILIILSVIITSCTSTKYVPEDKYLLARNKIRIEDKSINKNEIKNYLKQRPNKKIIGVRFHLFLYNRSNINKEKWPHGWLRKIGEKPVIWDRYLTQSTYLQFKQYLENKGYYQSRVEDTVKFKKRQRVLVTYNIIPNEPYYINNIHYDIIDTSLRKIIVTDTLNSLIKRGMLFDKEVLQQERIRIENLLKRNGYYKFSKEYSYFEAQPLNGTYNVNLTMKIKKFEILDQGQKLNYIPHNKYKINNVYVYPNYISGSTVSQRSISSEELDTVLYKNIHFMYNEDPRIKPAIINNANFIVPGQYYNQINVNKTYNKLSSLGLFKFINISFDEFTEQTNEFDREYLLDCNIELTKRKLQSYQFEIVGTNSSGDFGARGNLLYNNWNLFRGAEVFNLKLTGAYEAIQEAAASGLSHTLELGTEFKVDFPKFLLPLKTERFVKRFAPKTSISVSYNYQARPDYIRTIATASFGYNWRGNKNIRYYVYPLEINFVQLPFVDTTFSESISGFYLQFSYEDHFVGGGRIGFEYNNQEIGKSKDFVFLKVNVEPAGNILHGYSELANRERDSASNRYKIFNVPYSQYLKTDLDFRHYNIINPANSIVYRIFVGCAYPYGNSNALPFEKKYFSGGPNSIRAWRTRELGPGSYLDTSRTKIPNTMADIKLEANIEYRFKLFWKLEGALFLDMGNIWAINPKDERPGSLFDFKDFYEDIAIGTGFGARFDFSFFIIRLDFGFKLRDPAFIDYKWIMDND
ncbi:MAG: BamA/TamA family outer membrane protein, partial [Bacteroidales bacterium]